MMNSNDSKSDEMIDFNPEIYRDIYEQAPVGYILLDGSGRVKGINKTGADLLNVNHQESTGLTITDLIHADCRNDFEKYLDTVFEKGIVSSRDFKIPVKEKDYQYVQFHAVKVNPVGNEDLCYAVILDITEWKNTEQKLTCQSNLLENTHDAIITMDDRLRVTAWNRSAETMYGWQAGEALGNRYHNVVGSEATNAYLDEIFLAVVEKGRNIFEMVHHHQDGRRIYVEVSIIAVRDGKGYVSGYVTANRDISERKQMEESMAYLASFPELNPHIVMEVDKDGNVQYLNPTARRLFPDMKESGASSPWLAGLNMIYNDFIQEEISLFVREIQINEAWYQQTFHNIKNKQRIRVYGVDISERKRVEKELKIAKKIAEKASLAKSQFLGNMSHDLRTPLNAILGYAQLFRDEGGLTETQQNGIEIIYNSGKHLLQMINYLLDLTKIEAGKMMIERAPFHFPDFIRTIIEIISIQAQEKKLEFIYEPDGILPLTLAGDESRLEEVLLNLLSNAIKFTSKGRITLKIAETFHSSRRSKIYFAVEDTGIGIPKDRLEEIFDPFQQLTDIRFKSKGTGLGLTISRHLVQMMGGCLSVRSEPGQGSTFWFDLEFDSVEDTRPHHGDNKVKFEAEDSAEQQTIVLPEKEDLLSLIKMARIGDVVGIKQWIKDKELNNPEYSNFILKLKELTKKIRLNEICDYLGENLEGGEI